MKIPKIINDPLNHLHVAFLFFDVKRFISHLKEADRLTPSKQDPTKTDEETLFEEFKKFVSARYKIDHDMITTASAELDSLQKLIDENKVKELLKDL